MIDDPKNAIQEHLRNLGYRHIATIASFYIVFGAFFYHVVEKFSWLDSFYFTFVTLATIGYGDLTPKTAAGKVFTMFYALLGITIFIVLAKLVLGGVAVRASKRRQGK